MIIMSTDVEEMTKLVFRSDMEGTLIPCYNDTFFTGVIIDTHGELTYADGELVNILDYESRVLH